MILKPEQQLERCARVLRQRVQPHIHPVARHCSVRAFDIEGEPMPVSRFFEKLRNGDIRFHDFDIGKSWGTTWGTVWFEIQGIVPQQRTPGRAVELMLDLGWYDHSVGGHIEGMTYRSDGTVIKAVHPRNFWVPLVCDNDEPNIEIRADGTFTVYLEAACNPLLLGVPPFIETQLGDRATGKSEEQYVFRAADVCEYDRNMEDLYLDLETVSSLMREMDEASPRYWKLAKSLQRALNIYDEQDYTSVERARKALSDVLSQPANASAMNVTAIGHAHIDSAWLWPVRETRRKVARTISNVLALMDEDPDFTYVMSSAQQYAWLEEDYPELFEQVRYRVKEGRFIPVGGMWVESDGMLPTGESLIRQISFGKRYFASRFGVEPRGVWLPDSFGYTGAWPQIARRSGYDWFLTQKISWNDTTKVPHHSFMWEGIDGSRIFTHFPPSDTYAASVTAQELTYAEHNFKDKDIADRSLMLFGYGDGGGGPTREMLGRVHRFRNLEGVSRVAIDTPNHFFEQARHQLEANAGLEIPVWHGELYLELHRGTLTSQQEMKRGCRQEESLLRTTEYICAVAVLSCDDYEYPQGALDDIWKTLLLNQFHDVLPGSSIAWVHKEARTQYRRDIQRLKDIIAEAGDAIGSANTNVAILPKAKLRQYRLDGGAWCFDEVGTAVASGAVESRTPSDTAMRNAQDTSIEFGVQIKHLDDGRISLRNQYMEVTIESDGAISSLVDIHVGRELIVPGTRLGRYELLTDEPSVYDAWDIERDALLRVKDITNGEITGITQDDQGVSVESRTIHNDTTIVTTIRLASNSRQLDFHTHVDWHERERFLKVDVPLSITAQHAQYDCQYGIVERPVIRNTASDEAQFESCTNRFMRLHDSSYAMSVVNGSIYGSDIGPIRETSESMNSGALEGTMFRLSLLESPIFPDPREDVGEHDFSWAVVTDASIERTLDSACAINAPQIADVPAIEPLVYLCKTQGVPVIDWIKLADDGSGDLIVRIYEAAGGNARATIHLAELMKDASIRETNLLERPDIHDDLPHALEPVKSRGQTTTASDDVQTAEGSHISLKPFQLSTLRLSRG